MKKELKAMKPALKSSKKSKPAATRGGARKGAGRARYVGPMKQTSLELPQAMLDALKGQGVKNKTEYLAELISEDLKKRGADKQTLSAIEAALVKEKK